LTKYFGAVIGLIFTHLLLGRLFSIPYGMVLLGKWYWATLLILSVDMIEISVVFYILDRTKDRWRLKARIKVLFRRFRYGWESVSKRRNIFRKQRQWHSRILRQAQKWGDLGVLVITTLPFFGGGIWSGVLLARLLPISTRRRLFLLMAGSLSGCIFVSLGTHGFVKLLKSLTSTLLL